MTTGRTPTITLPPAWRAALRQAGKKAQATPQQVDMHVQQERAAA